MNKPHDEKPQLGEQELEVLRFVTDRAPVTVREVANEWGAPRNLARTTILTVMERLRTKGFLTRDRAPDDSTFQYSPAVAKTDLMRGLVQDFVEKTLGGSVAPFVAYLADAPDLSDREMEELRRIVQGMERKHGDDTGK
jgi:predicted transcriptional regulator